MIELVDRLTDAQAYCDAIGDPCERVHVAEMIDCWRNGREWPRFSAMTLPMRQVARILRGEIRWTNVA